MVAARCHEEAARPYGLVEDLLRALAMDPPVPTDDAAAPHAEALLASLVTRLALGELDNVVFVLEDLHWATTDTLDLLPRLVERILAAQARIVATYRTDGLPRTHRLRWVRSELRRMGVLVEIALRPLSISQTELLIREWMTTPTSDLVRRIHDRSRGVPFYVRELAHAAAKGSPTDLPDSIRDSVAARLARLSQSDVRTHHLAALLGESVDPETISALGGEPDALLIAGLLEETDDDRLRFRHELVRDALRREIPFSVRRRLHGEIAGHLDRSGAPARARADHWAAAGDSERARLAFLEAMDDAERASAYREAAHAGEEALRLTPAALREEGLALQLRIARHERLTGETRRAYDMLHELTENSLVHADDEILAEVHRSLAVVSSLIGREEESFRARTVAEAAFRRLGRPGQAAAELLQLIPTLIGRMRYDEAVDAARRATDAARSAGRVDLEARALGLAGHVLAMAGRYEEGRASAQEAFALAVRNELSAISAEAYRRLGGVLEYSSDFKGATEVYSEALDQCRNIGAQSVASDTMGCMTRELLMADDAPLISVATGLYNRAMIHAARGEIRSTERAVAEGEHYSRERGFALTAILLHWPRAYLLEHQGRDNEAAQEYREIVAAAVQNYDGHDLLPALCHASVCFARLFEQEELVRATDFVSRLEGALLRPGDVGYDTARSVWNGMFDRHPALIAHCRSERDVREAVRLAAEHGLLTAVKGGGHNVAGYASTEDGFLIDLSGMRTVSVDPEARRAVVDGGADRNRRRRAARGERA